MPAFPDETPDGMGVVVVTLTTGAELEAEWIDGSWWSHLNESPDAVPIDAAYVMAWRPLE